MVSSVVRRASPEDDVRVAEGRCDTEVTVGGDCHLVAGYHNQYWYFL